MYACHDPCIQAATLCIQVALIWLACCALKVLTSMTLLGYACRQVERCPAEGSAEGPGFLQGVERFTLHGKTAARK